MGSLQKRGETLKLLGLRKKPLFCAVAFSFGINHFRRFLKIILKET
jgi:hypothetical protein